MDSRKKRSRKSWIASPDVKSGHTGQINVDQKVVDPDDSSSDNSEEDLTIAAAPRNGVQDKDVSDDNMNAEERAVAAGESVSVDFIFSDPRESHFHIVKQFLLSYMPRSQPFDVSGLANAIVGQVTAGTMVSVEGQDDVYGFVTALNLKRFEKETSIQQVVQLVTNKCPSVERPKLQQILSTKNVALVINERMINLPYQLVPALHSALHKDIEWAAKNEDTEELRSSFQMDYFLILATCTERKSRRGGSSKSKKMKTTYDETTKFFQNFEDEFLEQEAEVTFAIETPLTGRECVDKSCKTTVVMLLERERHKAAITNISAMISV
ncbi:hypothetical protein PsorP6_009849 [Peronosclerospora sorghi]|uniref:Uncharacterized protein n=1 Tax=Peronosclerospora sorghi TaxID=230839 RepID=A0ACC0W2A8_9STRA|nr:hypothetical protein PsorP6_009849 [Peronosclerospora sorghi]